MKKTLVSPIVFGTVLISFLVEANDLCKKPNSNNNAPKFNQTTPYKGWFKESVGQGAFLIRVNASSLFKQEGQIEDLTYRIIKGDTKETNGGPFQTFNVDSKSGWIKPNGPLDYEDVKVYKFGVKVFKESEDDSNCADVEIYLEDVNEWAPTLTSKQDYTIPENTKNFELKPLIAVDKDANGKKNNEIRYYINKPKTNKLYRNKFELDEVTGKLKLIGDFEFDREKVAYFDIALTLKDQNGTGRTNDGETITIAVNDVNDNAPVLGKPSYSASVAEDSPIGYQIVQIFGTDKDSRMYGDLNFTIESGNDDGYFNIASYNYTEFCLLPCAKPKGKIPKGVNTSAWIQVLKPLDREKKDKFDLKIKASDGKSWRNPATTTVIIKVLDSNDEAPVFSKPVYTINVPENGKSGRRVVTVSATDADSPQVQKPIEYSLETKATGYLEIDSKTGVIKTGPKSFDYEKSSRVNFTVKAFDGKNTGTAIIHCIIKDMNDNPPYFIGDPYEFTVKENMKAGTKVGTIVAKDQDGSVDSEIMYKLMAETGDNRFAIHPDTGVITTVTPLDREVKSVYEVVVIAQDSGVPPYSNSTTVTINVADVNDNGPWFNETSYCGKVVEENSGKQLVAFFSVADPDTSPFSCPCEFAIVDGSDDGGKFKLYKYPDKKSASVYTEHKFDYEKKQKYRIWITAEDKANPAKKNKTYIDVDVVDINDNSPKSGGKLDLLVNAYKGKFKGGIVGRPYIIDDDKGTNDLYNFRITKQVSKQNQAQVSHFLTENDSPNKRGGIKAQANLPMGVYELTVEATEQTRGKATVTSSVTVTVREVTEKAVDFSLALRMTGLIHSNTCNKIRLPEFAKILSKILGVPEENVVVFSAQAVPKLHLGVDVRFAVKKKTGFAGDDAVYMKRINMIPTLTEAKKKIEQQTGGKVKSVGIDACAGEKCKNPNGFCVNKVIASQDYTIVTDDNGIVPANTDSKTFLSINTRVDAICRKGPEFPSVCPGCLNGGKCVNLTQGGFTCVCPVGFDGPQCQKTTISFKTAEAYIWLKPLSYFDKGEISLEFLTKKSNGLILYQGPISDLRCDFIALELVNAQIKLTITQGDQYLTTKTLTNGKNLNDGVYHTIKIVKNGAEVKLIVDDCEDAEVTETWGETSTQNRDKCEITGRTSGPYRMINGLNPLQLGRIKPKTLTYPRLTSNSFVNGCIRRLTDNGVMYDFANPVEKHSDVVFGCPHAGCKPACVNGHCDETRWPFKCVCLPGYIGDTCKERVKSYHYLEKSYSEYKIASRKKRAISWQDKYKTLYLVQVRTKTDGIIVYESTSPPSHPQAEYSILEIVNKQLRYRVHLGDKENTIAFPKVAVTDGHWHNVTVDRRGNNLKITIEKDGKLHAFNNSYLGTHQLLDTDGRIFTGGLPEKFKYSSPSDMQGCLGDSRVGGLNLDQSPTVELVKRKNVEVRCPCPFLKCLNGGYCMAGSPPYCICAAGYGGTYCEIPPVKQPIVGSRAGMSKEAYIIMGVLLVIFLLALILISLLLAGKLRKKKVYIHLDDDMKDNIMPYNDEGAGDDDFHNYDLEKLLKHANDRPERPKPAVVREDVPVEVAPLSEPLQSKPPTKFTGDPADTVDVARFISTRLADANNEDAAYPHDTMLHYGYEGEGSDVEDLSEIDSDGEESDDEADFGFLNDWGAKFDNLNKIFNPPSEIDEDV